MRNQTENGPSTLRERVAFTSIIAGGLGFVGSFAFLGAEVGANVPAIDPKMIAIGVLGVIGSITLSTVGARLSHK